MAAVVAFAHIVFGLPFLPVSAGLAGILQLIPFFGPIVSWAPPVVIAALTNPGAFIPTLIVVGIGWFVVGNILVPRIMSKAVGIHPLVVLVAVLVGVKIAGFAGAIFALPVAAIIAAFVQHYLARNANVPRDVTTRAAQLVGEREGRVVRVPKAPTAHVAEATTDSPAEPEAAAPARKRSRRSAESA
jgi:predicted PurR-regulated permease PerM